jgi:hypothetical protein
MCVDPSASSLTALVTISSDMFIIILSVRVGKMIAFCLAIKNILGGFHVLPFLNNTICVKLLYSSGKQYIRHGWKNNGLRHRPPLLSTQVFQRQSVFNSNQRLPWRTASAERYC